MGVCIYACIFFFISFDFNRKNFAEKRNASGRNERNFFSVLFLLLLLLLLFFLFMYVYVLSILQGAMTPGSFNQIQG